jgi:hypothetical protein
MKVTIELEITEKDYPFLNNNPRDAVRLGYNILMGQEELPRT